MCKCGFVLFMLFFSCINVTAQPKNEDDLKKQADKYFEDEDYNLAYKLYSQLVSNYPKDAEYNYRLGVCMLFTEPDKKKPFSYLKIATNNPKDAPKDAKFYLAKTYHINYQFDEALKLYNEYKQIGSSSSIKKLQVDREIEACKNGKRLLSNLSDLVVISKKQLNEADYFRSYDVHDIGGKLLVKPDDFRTSADKKKKEKSVIYLPKNGERIYYSSYGENGANGRDIYFVNKLPNGSWSKPQAMPSTINTEFDEDYPFLHPNGKTLYFSSKGHNSMGGYDVFKTTYNEATQTWGKPVNLDFPINSPDDDILFVTDSLEKTAFFSTGRYSPYGKIDVLKINTERRPPDFAFIKGTVVKEDAAQSVKSKIKITNIANGEIVGTFDAQDNGDYNLNVPNGGKFLFTVETPGIKTQSDAVNIPIAYTLKPYKQVISYDKKILKIINYFDGQVADENYSMMLDLIEKKAKLEVNENEPYNNTNLKDPNKNTTASNSLNSISTNNPTVVSENNGTVKNNTNKNVTNEQLLDMAKADAKEASEEALKLKKEAEDAFGLATQKIAEAAAIKKEADAVLANANSITDIAKKNEELSKGNNLKEDAKIASDVANTATNMAKKLEVDANLQQKEADLTNEYIKEIEAVTKNKNNKEALTKLEQIQKQLDDLSKQKNQSDELYASLKAEAELKQTELIKSEKKTNAITTEISTLNNESKELEKDLANETDNALKENIKSQIKELGNEIELKNKDLEANNQKIEQLKNEVEGINKEIEIAAKILNEKTENIAVSSSQNTIDKTEGNINITKNGTNETNNTSTNLSYNGIANKYKNEVNTTASSKSDLEKQIEVLKNYNKDVTDLITIDKNELSKIKDVVEKKKVSEEIKQLEKQKTDNEKLITSNSKKINQIESNTIASNNGDNSNNTSAINNNTTTSVNSNSISNNIENNTTENNTNNTINNAVVSTNTTSSENNNISAANTNTINSASINNNPSNSETNNSTYINALEKLKTELNTNLKTANEFFNYSNYKDNISIALKSTATNKYNDALKNENELNALITKTESSLKSTSNNAEALLNEAEALNNQALKERNNAASVSGEEKTKLLKQASDDEKLALAKKMEASTITQKENLEKFETNKINLDELKKLTESKTSNDVSQANLLADEAVINFNQAKKMREEANAYPNGSAKLGGISNAEEKENEALFKQEKSIQLLSKINPNYKVKTINQTNPTDAIALVNKEIRNQSNSQVDAFLALSKANQNEIKSQTDKLITNPNFKKLTNKEAQDLKEKADVLLRETIELLQKQSLISEPSEKATMLLDINKKEIDALTLLGKAAESLVNSNNNLANNANTSSVVSNTNSVSNSGTDSNNSNANNGTLNNNGAVSTTSVATNSNINSINNASITNTASIDSNNNSTSTNTNGANAENNTNTNTSENSNYSANISKNGIGDEASKLKASLNNTNVNTLTQFNAYTNTDAINLKNQAIEKINVAVAENKNLSTQLDNIINASSTESSSQTLNQQNIDALISESDKLSNTAFNLRKAATSKPEEEKNKDLAEAKQLEIQASDKKIEAANKQQQLNNATYNANKQSLEELANMAKGKNISELSNINQTISEADLYLKQATNLREETNSYTSNTAKLGGYSNAEEKEMLAIQKQESVLAIYKKYFSNYIPKQPTIASENPENISKFNAAKENVTINNQQYIDGLTLLAQANEKEYKSRFLSLPTTLTSNQTTLKTNAQAAFKKNQSLLVKASEESNTNNKKNLLIEANKNGQEAINLLSQIVGNIAISSTNTNTVEPTNTNTAIKNGDNTTEVNQIKNNQSANNATQNNTSLSTNSSPTTNSQNNKNTVTKTVKLNSSELNVKNTNAYSNEKPIPIDEKIPDGLVFKVQIGAFKSPLPNNTFKGLTPVIAQTTPSGYIRYMAGNFEQYENANAVKNDLKTLGYNDAFVVAYYNGVRINLNEATAKAKTSGQVIDNVASNTTSAGLTNNSNIPKNVITPITTNNTTALSSEPVIITNELEKMNGLLYTVQIGVYSKQVTRSQLYNLKPLYTELLPSGLYRYTAGIYNQTEKIIEDKRKVVDLGVKDAFISAYYNSKKIPFTDGKKLQTENVNLKMETQNPIIFNNTSNINVSTNTTTTSNNTTQPTTNNTTIPSTTTVIAFSNGVTTGPTPTPENGVKLDDSGISYKVQIGAYRYQVPNDVASKFLSIKTWPVNNVVINGLFIYTFGNFTAVSYAKKLRDEAVSYGITDAFITVYKDGKKLYGTESAQYLNK